MKFLFCSLPSSLLLSSCVALHSQVDLLVPTKITGIITQGAKDFGHVQFVGSYKVAYSNDGERWNVYQDEKQRKDKVSTAFTSWSVCNQNCPKPLSIIDSTSMVEWQWSASAEKFFTVVYNTNFLLNSILKWKYRRSLDWIWEYDKFLKQFVLF